MLLQNGKAPPFLSLLGSTHSITIKENCTSMEGASRLDDPYNEIALGEESGLEKASLL
jgi:hypothetical protein